MRSFWCWLPYPAAVVFTPRLPLHAITHHPSRRLIPHRHNRRGGRMCDHLAHPRKQRRTPPQLRTRLTRHLHNLKPRRRTLRAVNARPAGLALNIERFPTDLAISLHPHGLSLPIVAPLDPTSEGENFGGQVGALSSQKNHGVHKNVFARVVGGAADELLKSGGAP